MEDIRYSRYRKYYQRLEPVFKKPHLRAYTMAALSFFTLAFFGAFFIRPAITQIFELNRKISDRQQVNQKLEEKIKNLELAEKEYERVQADLPLILTALPLAPNFPPFLKTLEQGASISAISLKDLRFQDIEILSERGQKSATSGAEAALTQSLLFNLDLSGGYPNLLSFLRGLERGKRLANIEEFSLTSERMGTTSAELRMGLKGKVYFFPQEIGGKLE